MAKLPERSTTPELLQPEPATAAEPEPGIGGRLYVHASIKMFDCSCSVHLR